jgi:hypothetical protein
MEDDFDPEAEKHIPAHQSYLNAQMMLSELWIGAAHESVTLLNQGRLLASSCELKALKDDLRAVCARLQKPQAETDGEPGTMPALAAIVRDQTPFQHNPNDPAKTQNMPPGLSPRGSAMWLTNDAANDGNGRWIERRDLSEHITAIFSALLTKN